ncbi:MAG: energy-coupling factor transporter transmembrane component T, partial [Oscillospiraceae bacterium]
LDSRIKIILSITYIIMLFCAENFVALGICAIFVISEYLFSKVPLKMILKSLKPIIPILIITVILNLFFIKGETYILEFYFIKISVEGILFALKLVIRIILLIISSSLLTYTTTPIELTDAIERLLSPLSKIKFPVHELAMMMTIALRFIPTLIEETEKIMNAQKARGADIDTGGLIKRIKAMIPIFIPLFISAFRRAEELALAMDCRCYRGGKGRTRMKQLKMCVKDAFAVIVTAIIFTGVILVNIYF